MKAKIIIILISAGLSYPVLSQVTPAKITDSNTALHLLQPDYPVPYGPHKTEDITAVLNRIYTFLDVATPAKVIDRQTKAEIADLSKLTSGAIFEPGVFRLISYEWGVAYGAMLIAAEATGEPRYREYSVKRMNLIGEVTAYFKSANKTELQNNHPVRSVLDPRALDDAGSMCAAMIKTMNAGGNKYLRPFIDNYINNSQRNSSDWPTARSPVTVRCQMLYGSKISKIVADKDV